MTEANVRALTPEVAAELLGGRVQWRWHASDGCHSSRQSREDAEQDRVAMKHPDAAIERRVLFVGPWTEVSDD